MQFFLRFPRHKKVRKTSGNCMHADEWNNGVTKSSSLLNTTSTLFSFERVIKKSPSIVGLTNTFWFGVESGIKNTHTHEKLSLCHHNASLYRYTHDIQASVIVVFSYHFFLCCCKERTKKGLFHLCSWLGENYETICLFLFSLTRRDKKVSGKK